MSGFYKQYEGCAVAVIVRLSETATYTLGGLFTLHEDTHVIISPLKPDDPIVKQWNIVNDATSFKLSDLVMIRKIKYTDPPKPVEPVNDRKNFAGTADVEALYQEAKKRTDFSSKDSIQGPLQDSGKTDKELLS